MAKSGRGGKRTSATVTAGGAVGVGVQATQLGSPVDQPQVQIDNTQTPQPMSATYDGFMSMSDDQKADVIDNMVAQPTPAFLSDSAMQRFAFNLGLNDKPTLVDDDVLDTMTGTELFRTVNSARDTVHGLTFGADEIANQLQRGRDTRYSDSGGSAYGKGLYFANSYRESTAGYGDYTGNIQKTAVVRCKLNSNAKTIDYHTASTNLRSEINSGSKLGQTLSKIASKDSKSAVSIYAMSKGYNVITSGHGYFNVLNRNAVTMSKTIKAKSTKW